MNDQALYEHYVNGQGYGVLITQAIFNEITLDLLKDTENQGAVYSSSIWLKMGRD